MTAETARVEVERAPGVGVDFDRAGVDGFVGRRARPAGVWLGFDLAALVDSDDGNGRRVPVVVALPSSSFVGAQLEVELVGAWRAASGDVLVARLPGVPRPQPDLARIAAGLDDGATWLDAGSLVEVIRTAKHRYRERLSHVRVAGGRAWHAIGDLPPELARFATPHSQAEYRLATLPPRFVRGLEGLLDDEERILYWIERPLLDDPGLVERLRGRIDRRAALLVLTDRQLIWLVDHARPDRFLSDWGVDVELLPIERLIDARVVARRDAAALEAATPAGRRSFPLPRELGSEIAVMCDLACRFTPAAGRSLPRRTYPIEPAPFPAEAASRFSQEPEARALHDRASAHGEPLAFLFSPRRPGQRDPMALALRLDAIDLLGPREATVALPAVVSIELSLSPLIGRLAFGPSVGLTYPAPLVEHGARFTRLTRRALAATSGSPEDES